jgi:hypothetical protein
LRKIMRACRFDTTPMSSEVHGNGLGDEGKVVAVDPLGGFAVFDPGRPAALWRHLESAACAAPLLGH